MSSSVQPERLWRRLKRAGFGTRSRIIELIASGDVLLDGNRASPLAPVGRDSLITVGGEPLPTTARTQHWMYHKPVGIDCCIQPDRADSIARVLATLPAGLFPAGRLDKDSSGLLLLTNDGALCQRLMHPDHCHEKEYAITVDKDPDAHQLGRLRSGTPYLVGARLVRPRPCVVERIAPRQLRIILTQGMHRQVRRMCKAAGLEVLELMRIRLNRLLLGELRPGALRELGPLDLELLEA